MTKKKAFWLWAAILVILLISIYTIRIIFWPQYKFTGKVVDKETQKPITGAIAYILNSENYAFTDKLGIFELVSDQPGKFLINIEARGFKSKLCEDKTTKILTSTDLGTIYLENDIRVGWPVPDSLKNRNLNLPISVMSLLDYKITRSVRLSFKLKDPPADTDFFPRSHSIKDSIGGEWYLFFIWDSPYMITYINPDSVFERYIPTPLTQHGFRSMELRGNRLYLTGVLGKKLEYQEDYLDSFSVVDFRTDSDNDSLLDRFEIFCGLDPQKSDSDNDSLSDFDDPLPTIPRHTQYNDTTAVLETVLDEIEFTPLYFEFHSINGITENLKGNDRKRFINIAQKHVLLFQDFTSYYGSFEELLLKMNLIELQSVASILRNNYSDLELSNNFHCYKQLDRVNENNIEKIKAAILDEFSHIPIIPVNIQGDIVEFAAHPTNSWETILPISSFEFRRKVLERFYIKDSIKLIKMNATEAIVHYETKGFGYELVYVKREGNWKKVYEIQLYIS
jgi:hypothetical protein